MPFSNFFSPSLHLFNAVGSNLLQMNFESTSFVHGRLKLKNFGITLNILQLRKNVISSSAFLILIDHLSNYGI